MRAKVVTTITTELNLDDMQPSHSVDIDDCDGLSDVSREIVGALVLGALQSAERGVREQFPRAGRAAERLDAGGDQ